LPSYRLAPLVVREIDEMVARLRREGDLSIVVAEQNLSLALAVPDRVYVLERGEVVNDGSAAEFREDRSLQKQYLGV
jgi:branched-chain amino acid transport system ATP-binding protein